MKPILRILAILSIPLSAGASHGWSDIDLCTVYKDKLPPGLTAESLPEAESRGASLLDRYCTQCHNLPGPDRHNAAEWQAVVPKMFMLMDVASRFGGSRGKVEIMQPVERTILLSYLQRHAASPTAGEKASGSEVQPDRWLKRGLTLLPLLLLTLLGLLRWRQNLRRGYKPCVID